MDNLWTEKLIVIINFQPFWRMTLSNKMRNMRRSRDSAVPQIQAKKIKFTTKVDGTNTESDIPPKMNTPAFGAKNDLLQRPPTEDDASQTSHRKTMILQSSKKNMNVRLVETLMELTFSDRRSFTVKQSPSIAALKEEYPCLFDTYQVNSYFSY